MSKDLSEPLSSAYGTGGYAFSRWNAALKFGSPLTAAQEGHMSLAQVGMTPETPPQVPAPDASGSRSRPRTRRQTPPQPQLQQPPQPHEPRAGGPAPPHHRTRTTAPAPTRDTGG